MGYASTIGKYQIGRTIGEGTFAKVKLAINTDNSQYVAIKIINKHMVMENNLTYQVQSEIRTMKLLHHPNIVRIHEVIGTRTKIYIVMEYVSGGQLSDKMSYINRLNERDARKHFQQLIDAVDYCHCRGVYHRDLKVRMKPSSLSYYHVVSQISARERMEIDMEFHIQPQNLLLDSQGNLKVSDFGLSALRKPGDLLSTVCGSPSYVAPELLANRGYEGAAADVWSCGVILYELLAGYLPFDERSLMNLYRKISRAEYTFPEWFTESQKKLISRILEPNPQKRITTPEIIDHQWFQTNYKPAVRIECDEDIDLDDVHAAFNSDKDNEKQKTTLGSKHTINETIQKIEAAAKDVSLSVERMNKSKMKIHPKQKMTRCSRSCLNLSAEVIEVAPTHCVVEISKSVGDLEPYKESSTKNVHQRMDQNKVEVMLIIHFMNDPMEFGLAQSGQFVQRGSKALQMGMSLRSLTSLSRSHMGTQYKTQDSCGLRPRWSVAKVASLCTYPTSLGEVCVKCLIGGARSSLQLSMPIVTTTLQALITTVDDHRSAIIKSLRHHIRSLTTTMITSSACRHWVTLSLIKALKLGFNEFHEWFVQKKMRYMEAQCKWSNGGRQSAAFKEDNDRVALPKVIVISSDDDDDDVSDGPLNYSYADSSIFNSGTSGDDDGPGGVGILLPTRTMALAA
ncbi:hypothetical protein TEA_027257 [Camellia sinensis var. sinensis]|uniref:Protein kinase domain-containing protein n=1 Tax=Camellia sinensis var. sinensis TaxID=542762 RepID=A0A4S4DMQ9_CAMSN|nr:hypothetical protein TEA_027257 [Camellia sinensis var. sinensis]